MASFLCYDDLTCSVCLSIFTDPVTLSCGHSYCRQCLTDVHSCPYCREAVLAEDKCLPTSVTLESLAEKAREAQRLKEEGEQVEVPELCPEHEEQLNLFCVTEQQFACIICRDDTRHEGHTFLPINEAAALLREELEKFVQHVQDDIRAIGNLANRQREEITKTKGKADQLMADIKRQFEDMHQFMQRRENGEKNDLKQKLKDGIAKMCLSLNAIETALSERRDTEVKAASVLKISPSVKFLKRWPESKSTMTTEELFRPRANELQVVNINLCLTPVFARTIDTSF